MKAVYTNTDPVWQSEKQLMVVISHAAWKWNQTFVFMFILEGKKQAMKKKTYFVSRHSIKLKTSHKQSEQSEKKACS